MYYNLVTLYFPFCCTEYHCGSSEGWSDLFWFVTVDNGTNWAPKLAVFGDLGNINGVSLPYLQQEAQRTLYDVILHVGDFAYDMRTVSRISIRFHGLYVFKNYLNAFIIQILASFELHNQNVYLT